MYITFEDGIHQGIDDSSTVNVHNKHIFDFKVIV